jgi:putative PIN family toxin of toxin-antitoxin system
VVLSHYILEEMMRVLPRLSKANLSSTEIRDLADSFMFLADIVEPAPGQNEKLRDPADQPVLATWMAAQAHYLVTGDKDLLALASQYPTVSPAAFWARYGG